MTGGHKSAFADFREANKKSGSPIGEALFHYLENESPHPLDDFQPIPMVPMPAPSDKPKGNSK